MRSYFITFEGGEGSGKSTQLREVAREIRASGASCVETREPGGTVGAEAVRAVLLGGRARKLGRHAEAALFAAARADHVTSRIRPALAAGTHVLCDRFVDSSRAYQRDDPLLPHLERAAIDGLMPDLTLIYDVDPSVGTRRVRERDGALDRFEASDIAEQSARRERFLQIARDEADRCAVVDASLNLDMVTALSTAIIRERLPGLLAS